MSWSRSGRARWTIFGLLVLSTAVILSFQNCGKAGFDESGVGVHDLASAASSDTRISGAPFPYEANLNQISYMSCPMAGANTRKDPNDLLNPFFNVRAGAYDNLQYATIFRASSLTAPEKSKRLQAGIGLSQDFLSYLQTKFTRTDKDIVMQVLMGARTQNYRLTMALINEDRSRVEGGFGWDYQLFYPLADNLTGSVMANYLASAETNGNYGTKKQTFFSALEPSNRGLVASLSWGQNELDRDAFNSQLRSNLILTLGYAQTGATDITQLESPDADQFKTVYGRGYRMTFSNRSIDGLQALKSVFLSDIEEMNMQTKPISSIRSTEGQRWDCFALRIVRHIDRMNPATGFPYSTPGIYDFTTPSHTVIRGVKVACPIQTIDSMNTQVTENGVTFQKNLLRLQMARRVLPADLWEINTDPNYMCAVPTEAASVRGSCYASGDDDASKYIQYSLRQDMGNGTFKDCGVNGGNECPAYVSICYRSF
jgi:hypothetical protein